MVKKNPKTYSSQSLLKETMKKNTKTSLFNGCLRLTWVTASCQAIMEFKVVRFHDKIPQGVLSYINLIDIALKQCKDQESRTVHPLYDLPVITLPEKKWNSFYKLGCPTGSPVNKCQLPTSHTLENYSVRDNLNVGREKKEASFFDHLNCCSE